MDNDIRSPGGARWKKRYLLLGGMAVGAVYGASIMANRWHRNGKSSNGKKPNGAVEASEMVAVYSRGAEIPVLSGKDQAQSNGSAVAVDPERLGVVRPNGGSPAATTVEDAPSAGPHGASHGAPSRFSFKTFESLKYRDYRFLWFSIVFTAAGMWMEQIALSWMIYQMTDSAFLLGALNALRAVPFLVLGPIAGVAADRLDRKKLMFFSQAYVFVFTVGMALLIVSGRVEVWHLFAYNLFGSLGWAFTQPVRQTLIPNLVPRQDMMNAVALQSAGFNSTRVLGPMAAGVLIAWVGPGGAFTAKALAYIVVLTLIALMRVPPTPAEARSKSAASNLVEGFRYLGNNRIALSLIILALIPMLLAMPFQTLIPVFARDVLGMGPKGYGVLVSFAGLGAVTSSLIVASLGGFSRKGLLLLTSLTALGVALVLFSQSTWLPLSLFLMVFVGGFQMAYMSLNNTLIHLNITDNMRGRVMSIYMLDNGLTPLGALFAGTVAQFFGAPMAVTIMGASCIVLALISTAKVPVVRRLT